MPTTSDSNLPPESPLGPSSNVEHRRPDHLRSRLYFRISQWSTWICLLLLPGILYGLSQIKSSTAAVSQWLPSDGEQAVRYAKFLKWFDDDLYLILSWEGCRVENPLLTELAVSLRQVAEREPQLAIRRVTTSTDLLQKLTGGQVDLTREQALKRLNGVFVGPDETGMLFIELSGTRQEQYVPLIEAVKNTAEEILRLPRTELKLGGGIYEAVVIDEASNDSLKKFIIPSSLAALTVAWLCIRSLRLTFLIFVIAAYCQWVGIALIYYFGEQLNAILIVLPTLTFMLTVSAGVHLVNYYRDAGGPGNPLAGVVAIRAGWVPCVMASGTTAVGLLSLMVSQLKPVCNFGFFAAIAVICSTLILLLVFPTLVRWFDRSNRSKDSGADVTSDPQLSGNRFRDWAIDWIIARSNLLSTIVTVLLVIVTTGMFSLRSSVKAESMFESDSEILQNYSWLERNIGPLISVEVVLDFSKDCPLDGLERAEILAKLQRAVTAVPEVGGTYSALTFIPPLPQSPQSPQSGRLRDSVRRSAFRSKLEVEKDQLIDQGLLAVDDQGEHWRLTAKVPVLHSMEYGELNEKVVAACQQVSSQFKSGDGVSLTFTGLSPVFHEAQKLLFTDFAQSFAMAFLLITPLMILVCQSFSGGLLAMIPNVAPVVLVFGVMGWMDIPLDVASILTASVALGIAVDDTLHFITWFRRGRSKQQKTTIESTRFAFEKCASAMFQTTCICCAAMLVFLPTEFIPTRKFAILMSVMLTAALLGDLILLPALLSSRLGRWIYRDRRLSQSPSAST